MSAPVLSDLGERLRERTAPLAPSDERYGWVHAHLCEALARMLQQVADVWDPPDPLPPGAPLMDPELAPDWALPWVAQLVGVQLPAGASPDQGRALIAGVSGFKRGTPAALRAVAAMYLTGDKTVYFRERDPSGGANYAYTLEVVTLTSETPDPAAVLAALKTQKPGGLVLSYRTTAGWDYQAMTGAGGTYLTLKTTYSTYRNLSYKQPG
jgi:hypothetical protein